MGKFALIGTMALCACLAANGIELRNGAEFALSDIPAEATAQLPKRGAIRFLLEENGTTGYSWTAEYDSHAVEIALEHRAAEPGAGRLGAPGRVAVLATLKGDDAAPVFIELKYVRPWEKDKPPAKAMRVVLYKVKGGEVDSNYRETRTLAALKAECARRGIVITDWHVHLRGGMTPEKAAERERRSGIRSSAMENHGREWEIFDNARLCKFADNARTVEVNGHRLPVGVQVNDRDWFRQIDAATRAKFDYVLADTMIMGKLANGRDKRLWLVKDMSEIGDPEKWMDEYVKMNLQILDEPISILANPTYLPEPLNPLADALWTPARMEAILRKAVERGIAIEIQAESPYPRPTFLRLAKAMGAKFSFGTNNYDAAPKDLSRWLEAIVWLDLKPEDIWTPECLRLQTADNARQWPVLRTYAGENLRRVKMPIGGIGTGTISLSGRGALVDWEICNKPAKGVIPEQHRAASSFWIRTEDARGNVATRIMEGPIDTGAYEGDQGAKVVNHGFPRFSTCSFSAAYPLAQVALSDATMPVRATLEAMNPLVPGDSDASGIPAALLRWKVTNETGEPLKVSVLGFLVNPAAEAADRALVATNGVTGASIGTTDVGRKERNAGRAAIVVPSTEENVSVATRIACYDWRVRLDRFWKQFVATGKAVDLRDPAIPRDLSAVAVSVSFTLQPGAVRRVPFVIGWRFPNRYDWHDKTVLGNYYATKFATAEEAAARLLATLGETEPKTVAFVNGVLAANAPDVVKEAALFNLSTLRCETCFRTADGHFYGWEGCDDRCGSCLGSCTHVWGYEHALIDIWPDLAKDMSELQFGPQLAEDGRMSFRVDLPLATKARNRAQPAADGQMQCIVKAYENWQKGGRNGGRDDEFLKRVWPGVRKAIEFCWIPNGWDGDADGVMEGCQHNTMDVEYFGPNPQMEFLYLAALKAGAAMADAMGQADFAARCRDLVARGGAWTEKNLFNGEWYEHKVTAPGKIAPYLGSMPGNPAEPDFQLAAGCLVDQLVGDYAARAVGLGPVADEAHSKVTIDTILARTASSNVGAVYNCGRTYAFPEEPALKMAWYPKGRMPRIPFPYYGENMTGFEYVVAGNLAQRGDFVRAERVVRDIRNRYDGKKRNPFDEAECGHHYARAMAAWSVLKAFEKGNGDK